MFSIMFCTVFEDIAFCLATKGTNSFPLQQQEDDVYIHTHTHYIYIYIYIYIYSPPFDLIIHIG